MCNLKMSQSDSFPESESENYPDSDPDHEIKLNNIPLSPPPPSDLPPPSGLPETSIISPPEDEPNLNLINQLPSNYYQCVTNYTPDKKIGHLRLRVGDILIVSETISNLWWRGTLGLVEGIFPSSNCKPITKEQVKEFLLNSSNEKIEEKPLKSRKVLENEMEDLNIEMKEAFQKINILKTQIKQLQVESNDLRKQTQKNLLESYNILPPCFYQINSFEYLKLELLKNSLLSMIWAEFSEQQKVSSISINESFNNFNKEILPIKTKLGSQYKRLESKIAILQENLNKEIESNGFNIARQISEKLKILSESFNENIITKDLIENSSNKDQEIKSPKSPKNIKINDIEHSEDSDEKEDDQNDQKKDVEDKNSQNHQEKDVKDVQNVQNIEKEQNDQNDQNIKKTEQIEEVKQIGQIEKIEEIDEIEEIELIELSKEPIGNFQLEPNNQ